MQIREYATFHVFRLDTRDMSQFDTILATRISDICNSKCENPWPHVPGYWFLTPAERPSRAECCYPSNDYL